MKHIKYIAIILSFFLANPLWAQEVLNKYLEIAATNNPKVKSTFNEYLASLERIPQVKALPDPQLAFGYFIQPVETRLGPQEYRISLSQMFPWLGTRIAKEEVAIQQAKAKYEIFEDVRSELYYDLRSTYYNLFYTQEAINITLENIEILETYKKLALVKVEAGSVSAVDEIRVELELADLNNELLLLQDMMKSQKVQLNSLLNVDTENEVIVVNSLDKRDIAMTKEIILDSIISKNHQLKKLDLQSSALAYQEILAKKTGMPSFSIGMDYIGVGTSSGQFQGDDAFMFPKIGISIPLYRNKYKAMVNEVIYLNKAKLQEKENKENLLRSIFENAWKDYNDASRRIELYQHQANLAKGAVKLLEAEYATQGVNFEEILRMERYVLKYELSLKKAISDQHASVAFITYLMGNN